MRFDQAVRSLRSTFRTAVTWWFGAQDMILTIGYFTEPAGPDVRPANLMVAKRHFATLHAALAHRRSTANRLHAHSLIFPMESPSAKCGTAAPGNVRIRMAPKAETLPAPNAAFSPNGRAYSGRLCNEV